MNEKSSSAGRRSSRVMWIPLGIVIVIGVVIGSVMDNPALGVVMGLMIGVVLAASARRRNE
jgi:hypothetical protein